MYQTYLDASGNVTNVYSRGVGFFPDWAQVVYAGCCYTLRGDYNGDGQDATILDVTFLVDDLFRGGPSTECSDEADVNDDGGLSTVLDLTYLVDNIFRGGPLPPACP
jgi:hypothetical protein